MSHDSDARSSASPDTETTREVIGERRLKCLRDLAVATGDAHSVADVCRAAAEVIGANAADVAFSLIYLRDPAGNTARLLACSGCAAGESFSPEVVTVTDTVTDTGPGWPRQPTLPERGGVLHGLDPALGLPAAPWRKAATSAAILPLARSGRDQVRGYLIAAAAPGLAFDEPYAHFLELLAGGLAGALADAQAAPRAAELEKQHLDFLAMLSHELRNPLAPITTALELMRLRGGGSFERERAIIERQARQLVSLVDDLMDVSRITRGTLTLKPGRVELAEVVAQAIETVGPLLEQRRHTLTAAVPQELVVPGDAARLTQVVSNLLSNAARYTEPAGRISIEAQPAGAAIVLTVRDNGTGIRAELLPRVFDMFARQRDDSDRSQGGLGLGLSIVRSIVALHGGEISAHSDGPGRGSAFTVRLPALAASPSVARAPVQEAAPRPRAAAARRVLVVDDNEDAARTLAAYLEGLGHAVRIAYDGPGALRIAAEFAPDAVLLDIALPVMDGYEVARRLRAQSGPQRMCLVAVTGYGQRSERARTDAAGFDTHLAKPVDLPSLTTLLDKLEPVNNRS